MAKIGCKLPCFKPDSATAGVVLGELVAANLTINYATGELYGDDHLVERASEFANGEIALETSTLSDDNAKVLYGVNVTDGVVTCNVGDTAPRGRFAYYQTLKRGGVNYFRAYRYPQVSAVMGNSNAQTKGSSINFTTEQSTLTVFPDENGVWQEFETFDKEADAISFVKTYCSIAASGGGTGKG